MTPEEKQRLAVIVIVVLIFVAVALMLIQATMFYEAAYQLARADCRAFEYLRINMTLP